MQQIQQQQQIDELNEFSQSSISPNSNKIIDDMQKIFKDPQIKHNSIFYQQFKSSQSNSQNFIEAIKTLEGYKSNDTLNIPNNSGEINESDISKSDDDPKQTAKSIDSQTHLPEEEERKDINSLQTHSTNQNSQLTPISDDRISKLFNKIGDLWDKQQIANAINQLETIKEKKIMIDKIITRRKEIERANEVLQLKKVTPMLKRLAKKLMKRSQIKQNFTNLIQRRSVLITQPNQLPLLQQFIQSNQQKSGLSISEISNIQDIFKSQSKQNFIPILQDQMNKKMQQSTNALQTFMAFFSRSSKEPQFDTPKGIQKQNLGTSIEGVPPLQVEQIGHYRVENGAKQASHDHATQQGDQENISQLDQSNGGTTTKRSGSVNSLVQKKMMPYFKQINYKKISEISSQMLKDGKEKQKQKITELLNDFQKQSLASHFNSTLGTKNRITGLKVFLHPEINTFANKRKGDLHQSSENASQFMQFKKAGLKFNQDVMDQVEQEIYDYFDQKDSEKQHTKRLFFGQRKLQSLETQLLEQRTKQKAKFLRGGSLNGEEQRNFESNKENTFKRVSFAGTLETNILDEIKEDRESVLQSPVCSSFKSKPKLFFFSNSSLLNGKQRNSMTNANYCHNPRNGNLPNLADVDSDYSSLGKINSMYSNKKINQIQQKNIQECRNSIKKQNQVSQKRKIQPAEKKEVEHSLPESNESFASYTELKLDNLYRQVKDMRSELDQLNRKEQVLKNCFVSPRNSIDNIGQIQVQKQILENKCQIQTDEIMGIIKSKMKNQQAKRGYQEYGKLV